MNIFEKFKAWRKEKKNVKKQNELDTEIDSDERQTWGNQIDFFLSTLGYAGMIIL